MRKGVVAFMGAAAVWAMCMVTQAQADSVGVVDSDDQSSAGFMQVGDDLFVAFGQNRNHGNNKGGGGIASYGSDGGSSGEWDGSDGWGGDTRGRYNGRGGNNYGSDGSSNDGWSNNGGVGSDNHGGNGGSNDCGDNNGNECKLPVVPEPVTMVSLAMAVGGIGAYVRKRRATAP